MNPLTETITYRKFYETREGCGLREAFYTSRGVIPDAPIKCNCGGIEPHTSDCILVQAHNLSIGATCGIWVTNMDLAPKNARILLLTASKQISIGHYDDDRHCQKPRPFWILECYHYSRTQNRQDQPIAWMPLPSSL